MSDGPSRATLLNEITVLKEELNHPPTEAEITRYSDYTESAFRSKFGSVSQARQAAGMDEPTIPAPTAPLDSRSTSKSEIPSHDELLQDIYLTISSVGHEPSKEDMLSYVMYAIEDFRVQFGSFDAALERVNETLDETLYDIDGLSVHLEDIGAHRGRRPLVTDVLRFGMVPPHKYAVYFESWTAALQQAGFSATEYSPTTRAVLIDEYNTLWDKYGRPPRPIDVSQSSKYSVLTYLRRFGTWGGIIHASDKEHNLGPAAFADTQKLLLALELRRIAARIDEQPNLQSVATHTHYQLEAYQKAFTKWKHALSAAGLEPACNDPVELPPREVVYEQIRSVAAETGIGVTFADVVMDGGLSPKTVFQNYGSWECLRQRTGLSRGESQKVDPKSYPITAGDLVLEDRLRLDNGLDTTEVYQADFDRVADELGAPPRPVELDLLSKFAPADYIEIFGSWQRLIEESAASLKDCSFESRDPRGQAMSGLLHHLEQLAIADGQVPSSYDIDTWTSYTATSYCAAFGDFASAIEESGIRTADPSQYAADVLESELQRIGREFDCCPPVEMLSQLTPYEESAFQNQFRRMNSAWRRARRSSPEPFATTTGPAEPEPYRTQLLEELSDMCRRRDKPPDPIDVATHTPFSPETYLAFFGSWPQAVAAAGQEDHMDNSTGNEPPLDPTTESEILYDIWETAVTSGSPTRFYLKDYDFASRFSKSTIRQQFGSVQAAVDIAGLDHSNRAQLSKYWYPPLDIPLVNELERVGAQVPDKPAMSDMNANGRVSAATYIQRFGSWENALDAANFSNSYRAATNLEHDASVTTPKPTDEKQSTEETDPAQIDDTEIDKETDVFEANEEETAVKTRRTVSDDKKSTDRREGKQTSRSGTRGQPDDEPVDRLDMVLDLLELKKELGQVPTKFNVEQRSTYSVEEYCDEFGSWETALENVQ